jgi:hypothetical protein
MKFWRKVLRGLPVVALVCGMLPAPGEAQFIQQGPKLVATDAIGDAEQGRSVSLSNDGNTAIVGGEFDNGGVANGVGAAWIYIRSGGVWSEQAKLVATDAIGGAAQGDSVSLSADGNTAIVGGLADNGGIGAAWVYTRSGRVWSQQAKLVGTGAIGGQPVQGASVSLSGDGNTAMVGGPIDDGSIGAAWVYTRSGGVWTQQAKLVGTGVIGPAAQGESVALSGDGNTAIVGGPDDDNGNVPGAVGAAWVYTRARGVWTQQAKLVGTGAIGGALQGTSVALSSDGNTAIVGGPDDDDNGPIPFSGIGAAWVYIRSNGVWSQQTKLVGTGVTGGIGAQQGDSVSLSGDGNTAIVGGPDDNNRVGAAWVFTRSNGVWSQQAKLVGTGAIGRAGEGASVSLSGDGRTAMVGGPIDDSSGAAWVFAEPVVFAGTPGKANCHGKSVSALAKQFGGLNNAAAALGFDSVSALQEAIMSFCGG